MADEEGRLNPLAGMGLTDEQYNVILQNIVHGDGFMGGMGMVGGEAGMGAGAGGMGDGMGSGGGGGGGEKRQLDDGGEDGREGKRSRFEVVE